MCHLRGRTQWCGVAGNADHDDVPLSVAHHWYVGSVTKRYTATLVLEQDKRGVLSLSATIDEWFDLGDAKDLTVRMVMSHLSGVPKDRLQWAVGGISEKPRVVDGEDTSSASNGKAETTLTRESQATGGRSARRGPSTPRGRSLRAATGSL